MEYLNDYTTAIRHVASKIVVMEGGLYSDLAIDKEYTIGMYCSGQVDLAYDKCLKISNQTLLQTLFV